MLNTLTVIGTVLRPNISPLKQRDSIPDTDTMIARGEPVGQDLTDRTLEPGLCSRELGLVRRCSRRLGLRSRRGLRGLQSRRRRRGLRGLRDRRCLRDRRSPRGRRNRRGLRGLRGRRDRRDLQRL